jgi:hypothetical protein
MSATPPIPGRALGSTGTRPEGPTLSKPPFRTPAFNPLRFSLPPRNVSEEERCAMIAKAAYFLAERRAFAPGHELEDWLAAEREVDERLARSGRR